MYYPYLRGRQFELIALREYALQRGANNNVIPIIEPVKGTFNSMKLALPKLIEGKVKFALILNPQVGEIKKVDESTDVVNAHKITDALADVLNDIAAWIPAFVLTNNLDQIKAEIEVSGYSDIMLICSDITNTDTDEFFKLASSEKVKYIVTKDNRTLKRNLKGKELIRLDDNFKAQKRNSDYLPMMEEKFSEEHLYYKDDGYMGFSDYTVVVSDYIEGGAAPYAVAIHLTYKKENGVVWIKHFTSFSNDDKSNIQGKFAEAANKAVAFLNFMNIHNCASEELREYVSNQAYPGLGMVKKISIKNHLELINGLIKSGE